MALAPARTLARHTHSIWLCVLFMIFSCAIACAQGGVGSSRGLPSTSDGVNTIRGHVFFPVEPAGGKRVKVRITSLDLLDQTAQTDDNGIFEFNRLPAGHFTITIDAGQEFDQVSEPVSIDREASP